MGDLILGGTRARRRSLLPVHTGEPFFYQPAVDTNRIGMTRFC